MSLVLVLVGLASNEVEEEEMDPNCKQRAALKGVS
jgi:hypothetical protein